MKNLTPEMIGRAKAASTVDELLAIAKENDIELTEDEAKTYFAQLNANGAVSDEELDLVAGGGCNDEVTYEPGETVGLRMPCPDCEYRIGMYVKADGAGGCFVQCLQCHGTVRFIGSHDAIEKFK